MSHSERTSTQTELAAALRVVLRIGLLALRSGAASFRTQEVMARCASALGVRHWDVHVTPLSAPVQADARRAHSR
ncbi:MAG: hypothetical protein CUN49_17880 [Candidatus Thermofonsia Clade 1 bacterium]|uniref:Uncharacterized protein n=1 Tax=Candidatus Thermofonsia Clade 1 bacterium TaxID=2364210 RepID=A0A2M8P861_9CHLR|nr:MAG: hypothetical protein CUN49_17880 [Candidatus Thermofonsia Clade 1 bacterium]